MFQFDRHHRRDRRLREIFGAIALKQRLQQSADTGREKHDQRDDEPNNAQVG